MKTILILDFMVNLRTGNDDFRMKKNKNRKCSEGVSPPGG